MATVFSPRRAATTSPSHAQSFTTVISRPPSAPPASPRAASPVLFKAPVATGPDYDSLFVDEESKGAKLYRIAQKRRDGMNEDAFSAFLATQERDGQTFFALAGQHRYKTPEVIDAMSKDDLDNLAVIFAHKNMHRELLWCITLGARLDYVNSPKNGLNVLEAAAHGNAYDTVVMLIDKFGLNPNYLCGDYPLCMAGASGSEKIVKYLVSRGAWLSGTNANDNNVLHILLEKCHVSTATNIILHYSSLTAPKPNEKLDFTKVNYRNDHPLSTAVLCLTVFHGEFLRNNDTYTLEQLKQALEPAIALCRLVQKQSQLPYGATYFDVHNKRRSNPPIYHYSTCSEKSLRLCIRQIRECAPDFLREIINSGDNNSTNSQFNTFSCMVADVERTSKTPKFST